MAYPHRTYCTYALFQEENGNKRGEEEEEEEEGGMIRLLGDFNASEVFFVLICSFGVFFGGEDLPRRTSVGNRYIFKLVL